MTNQRPVTRLPICAAPDLWPGLRVFFILLLVAGFFSAMALAAPANEKKPAAPAAAGLPAGYVGSETCAGCHEAVVKGFEDNPHTKMVLQHGSNGVTCENCHGAGQAHVEGGGDVTKIFNPAKHSNKEVNATCEKCHAATHPNFDRSPHAKADVGCISCHSVHAPGKNTEHLLKASQPTLCFQCHTAEKPQFNMPFHHKVNEGAVNCSDCHDPHGTFGANNLKSTADQNAICTKCHMEKRGPFSFEHAPVKGDGCLSCHTPHGSQNARMLNAPSVNALCRQCHSAVVAGSIHSLNAAGSNDVTPCIDCHTMVHGSNIDRYLKR